MIEDILPIYGPNSIPIGTREKNTKHFIVNLCTRKQSSRAFEFFYYELFFTIHSRHRGQLTLMRYICFIFFPPRDMKDISKEICSNVRTS